MVLDIADKHIQASLKLLPNNRARITITYPRVQPYHDQVLHSLSRLLKPSPVRGGQPVVAEPTGGQAEN